MRCYYIDAANLSASDRMAVNKQLEDGGYIYNPVPYLTEFTFYAEDCERVEESLKLPSNCVIREIC